jgi:hypothetical protein
VPIRKRADTRVDDCPAAHRARLERSVERAIGQIDGAQLSRRFADCHRFAMRRRVERRVHPVLSLRDDAAGRIDDDGADWPVARRARLARDIEADSMKRS